MFVCKVAEETDIDIFAFNFTRTLDDDTSIKSLFQIIEEVKNGYLVSAMFGKPLEILIDSPFVVIFTNEDISSYFHYLSIIKLRMIDDSSLYSEEELDYFKGKGCYARYQDPSAALNILIYLIPDNLFC